MCLEEAQEPRADIRAHINNDSQPARTTQTTTDDRKMQKAKKNCHRATAQIVLAAAGNTNHTQHESATDNESTTSDAARTSTNMPHSHA